MSYFFNRIFYSFFCFEQKFAYLFYKALHPLSVRFSKFLFHWNPFNKCKKTFNTYDEYVKEAKKGINFFIYNLDSGCCINNAIRSFIFGIFANSFFIFVYIRYYIKHHYCLEISFLNFTTTMIAAGIFSIAITHFMVLRKDKFKLYFERFENEEREIKKNKIWHVVSFIYFITSCVLFIRWLLYWFD